MLSLLLSLQADPAAAAERKLEYPALLGVAIVAVVVLGLQVLVLIRKGSGFGSVNFRMWGLSLVIFSGLAVLILDPPEGQANAAWGLLGVIAGYVFGQSQKEVGGTTE